MNNNSVFNDEKYVVGLIFSNWSLTEIKTFLEVRLEATTSQIGIMRVDRFQDKETNRTIILMDRQIYDRALTEGLDKPQKSIDFKITEYQLRPRNYPRDGFSNNLFIPLPKELNVESASKQIQLKIDICVKFGLLEKGQAKLAIPLKSRELGSHRGAAYITFPRDFELAPLVKVVLSDTRLYLPDETNQLMKVFWARDKKANRNNRKNRRNKSIDKPLLDLTKQGSNQQLLPPIQLNSEIIKPISTVDNTE